MLALGADAAQTGYLQTAQTLPFLLLSLPAGVLADRMQRRLLMSAAECARREPAVPAGAALVRPVDPAAAGRAGFPGRRRHRRLQRGRPALVPRLVAPAELAGANRWLELARSAAFSAGPAAGGALVSALGASAAYALATALSLLAALLLAGLPADAPAATATRRHIGRELSDGAAVLRHPLLRPVLVTAVFFNVAWFVLQAVYVVYAIRDRSWTPPAWA